MAKTLKRLTGDKAECIAKRFLGKHNFVPVAQNFTSRFGEIDLIVRDKKNLVFVEVRYRSRASFANPISTVNYPKQLKIIKTAEYFLFCNRKFVNLQPRFDVLGITKLTTSYGLNWIKDAFQL